METPETFEDNVARMAKYITDYFDNIRNRKISPHVFPGFMRELIPDKAPQNADKWEDVFEDIDKIIMPGVSFR